MDPEITLLNGQPIPRDVKELATDDSGGVNTAVVAFLDDRYVRTGDQDTQIRPAPKPPSEVDTLIEKPIPR